MCPAFTVDNAADTGISYTELLGEAALRNAVRGQSSDLANFLGSQLRAVITLTTGQALRV